MGFGGLEWSCVYRRAFSHTQMRNPEKLNTSIQIPIYQYNRQRELLAEIAWAPEVGMRHTLAAGSLPFTSLNQVGGCLFGSWCGVGGDHSHTLNNLHDLVTGVPARRGLPGGAGARGDGRAGAGNQAERGIHIYPCVFACHYSRSVTMAPPQKKHARVPPTAPTTTF